jgi:hypothetical protein
LASWLRYKIEPLVKLALYLDRARYKQLLQRQILDPLLEMLLGWDVGEMSGVFV